MHPPRNKAPRDPSRYLRDPVKFLPAGPFLTRGPENNGSSMYIACMHMHLHMHGHMLLAARMHSHARDPGSAFFNPPLENPVELRYPHPPPRKNTPATKHAHACTCKEEGRKGVNGPRGPGGFYIRMTVHLSAMHVQARC